MYQACVLIRYIWYIRLPAMFACEHHEALSLRVGDKRSGGSSGRVRETERITAYQRGWQHVVFPADMLEIVGPLGVQVHVRTDWTHASVHSSACKLMWICCACRLRGMQLHTSLPSCTQCTQAAMQIFLCPLFTALQMHERLTIPIRTAAWANHFMWPTPSMHRYRSISLVSF
jgi:hypothetical protein